MAGVTVLPLESTTVPVMAEEVVVVAGVTVVGTLVSSAGVEVVVVGDEVDVSAKVSVVLRGSANNVTAIPIANFFFISFIIFIVLLFLLSVANRCQRPYFGMRSGFFNPYTLYFTHPNPIFEGVYGKSNVHSPNLKIDLYFFKRHVKV